MIAIVHRYQELDPSATRQLSVHSGVYELDDLGYECLDQVTSTCDEQSYELSNQTIPAYTEISNNFQNGYHNIQWDRLSSVVLLPQLPRRIQSEGDYANEVPMSEGIHQAMLVQPIHCLSLFLYCFIILMIEMY